MNVMLEPDVADWIDTESRLAGVTPEVYVAQRLVEQKNLTQKFFVLPNDESELLSRINEGLPEDFWVRYRALIARRQALLLSAEEQQELISLSDQIEQKNAERAPYLIALARRRGVSVSDLVRQLGLRPASLPV